MTLLNIINAIILVVVAVCSLLIYRHVRRKYLDADGVGDINTRGPDGDNSQYGDVIVSIDMENEKDER